jgi:hypothetical protein
MHHRLQATPSLRSHLLRRGCAVHQGNLQVLLIIYSILYIQDCVCLIADISTVLEDSDVNDVRGGMIRLVSLRSID